MNPMPSGGRRIHRKGAKTRRGRVGNVRTYDAIETRLMARAWLAPGIQRGSAGTGGFAAAASWRLGVFAVHLCARRTRGRGRIRAMNPMPSGEAGVADESADATELDAGGAAQGRDLGRASAVLPAGAAAAGEAGGRARSGSEAAMEAAAAVGHGGLPAFAAAVSMGTAAGRGQEITGGVAVLQPAPARGWEARRIRAINPMSSGERR